jgi:hypothetical protein
VCTPQSTLSVLFTLVHFLKSYKNIKSILLYTLSCMKEHLCKHCNKLYSSKQSLCNHVKKFHNSNNTPYIPNNIPIYIPSIYPKTTFISSKQPVHFFCSICNKNFKHYKSKWRHEKTCKNKKTELTAIVNNTLTNSNNNSNNNNNNHIIINNYSTDNTEYITEAFIQRMFNHLKYKDEHHIPIPKVIENIKFNPNHKENNNVKITNMRSKVGMKYDNNKWLTVDKDILLNELYRMGLNMLKKWSEKEGLLTDEMKKYYAQFDKISKIVLKANIKEDLNKKGYIYTKNMDTSLDI